MQKIGAHSRRKSYAHAQPCFPRKMDSRQSGTRTLYQQLPPLSEQLKSFRRKMLFDSIPSVQTLPSISKNQNGKNKTTKNQKTRYNSQLSVRKYNQTLMTMGSQTDVRVNKSIQISKQMVPNKEQSKQQINQNGEVIKLNVDEDNERKDQNQQIQQNNQQNENNMNQQDELQGYTMGNQIQDNQSQDQNKGIPKLKSYASDNYKSAKTLHNIFPRNQQQASMEYKYIQSKYRFLKDRHEDVQFLRMINTYKSNKQKILRQLSKKNQSIRALSLIKKVNSLPKLAYRNEGENKTKQIMIPSYEQLRKNPQQQQSSRSILNRRLECSMSYGKLQMMQNANKNKDINYEQLLEEQLNEMMKTERLLRDKGIKIDVTALKNSFLNIRNTPIDVQHPFAKPRLISNPYDIKQKTKKKRI